MLHKEVIQMSLPHIQIGNLTTSKFILGSNPFSGFSHRGIDRDREMIRYFTVNHIKETFKQAEKLGITTMIGRGDQHIIRTLIEYWDEGGTIQWIAQTCPEMKSIQRSVEDIISGGASAGYIHGGVMDFLVANNQLDEVPVAIRMLKDAGLTAGVAGHDPGVFEWAEENLDVDFYMCSYYNSAHRNEEAEHIHGKPEWFLSEDRDIMVKLIQRLSKPVIHYKILAAGRNDSREAFNFTARHLRQQDGLCVGIYPKDNPKMLEEDVQMILDSLNGIDH